MTTHRETTEQLQRHDQIAGAVFSVWVVAGLFVDGWAHNAEKPEDFWTPWHMLLYSGFVAAVGWFAAVGALRRARGFSMETPPAVMAGFGLFALGGVGDSVWHSIFGVEEDVEALLSPTHLTLMTGGLLLISEAVRTQVARGATAPSLRSFWPAAVGITLLVAVVAFFLQFAAAFGTVEHAAFDARAGDEIQVLGVASILLTNLLLLGATAWTLRRWPRTPVGTFTLVFGGVALAMSGLEAFDQVALVAAAGLAGAVVDLLVARRASIRSTLLTAPVVLWSAWFAVYHAVWGLGWTVELWTGSIFLATVTGAGLALLVDGPGVGAPADDVPVEPQRPTGPAKPPLRTPHRTLAELLA